MKVSKDLRGLLNRLEAVGNDDFQLILLGGASAYATHELHHLLRRLRIDGMRRKRYRKQLFALAASIPLLLGLATLSIGLNRLPFAYAGLGAIIVIVGVLFWGQHHLNRHYGSLHAAEELKSIIQREIARRRSDAEIR